MDRKVVTLLIKHVTIYKVNSVFQGKANYLFYTLKFQKFELSKVYNSELYTFFKV